MTYQDRALAYIMSILLGCVLLALLIGAGLAQGAPPVAPTCLTEKDATAQLDNKTPLYVLDKEWSKVFLDNYMSITGATVNDDVDKILLFAHLENPEQDALLLAFKGECWC